MSNSQNTSMPSDQRNTLTEQYTKAFGPPTQRQADDVRHIISSVEATVSILAATKLAEVSANSGSPYASLQEFFQDMQSSLSAALKIDLGPGGAHIPTDGADRMVCAWAEAREKSHQIHFDREEARVSQYSQDEDTYDGNNSHDSKSLLDAEAFESLELLARKQDREKYMDSDDESGSATQAYQQRVSRRTRGFVRPVLPYISQRRLGRFPDQPPSTPGTDALRGLSMTTKRSADDASDQEDVG